MKISPVIIFLALALLWPLQQSAQADPVIINDLFPTVRCVVHELEDDEHKAEVVRSIVYIRDKFFPGREIVDATLAGEAALSEKLKDGFVLYGTFHEGSALLRAVGRPVGFEVVDERAHFGDYVVPAEGFRFIFAGKNPYADDGTCIVYAAGRNEHLRNVNALFHGPHSFHLFHVDTLVQQGFYGADFTFRDLRVPAAEALEDVDQFFSSLERVHPDLLADVSPQDYIALRRSTVSEVVGSVGEDGALAVERLAYILYLGAARFGDGHTSVHWTRTLTEANTKGDRFPPFLLDFRKGKFVITTASVAGLGGGELLAVNGTAFETFAAPILERSAGELFSFRAARFTNRQGFWWSFSGLLASMKRMRLTVRERSGEEREVKVRTVRFAEFDALQAEWREETRRGKEARRTHYTLHCGGTIAHLVYPAFRDSEEERETIDRIFTEIEDTGVSDLIIDLRGNGGGSSKMGEYIFRYLTDRAFCFFSKMRIRISEDLVARSSYFRQFASLTGLVVTMKEEERSWTEPEAAFAGRACLLVDNSTFSSASGFAAMFRDYEVGEILGYETGGLAVCFGDVFQMTLGNSRIPYGVSCKQFFGPRPRPGDDAHGILPDVAFTDELLAPYMGEDDPALAFTLERVISKRDGARTR